MQLRCNRSPGIRYLVRRRLLRPAPGRKDQKYAAGKKILFQQEKPPFRPIAVVCRITLLLSQPGIAGAFSSSYAQPVYRFPLLFSAGHFLANRFSLTGSPLTAVLQLEHADPVRQIAHAAESRKVQAVEILRVVAN